MQGIENQLTQPLILDEAEELPKKSSPTSRMLIIEPHGPNIIFRFQRASEASSPTIPAPTQGAARIFYHTMLSFVMVTKCVASSGMMVFAERDLLENQHYIFWKVFFRHLPEFSVDAIIACTVFSDAFMNLVTRGSATSKMLRGLLYGRSESHLSDVPGDNCWMTLAKGAIMFCGGLSSVTASLVAFLGAVTLGHYLTDNIYLLMAWGSLVAAANFVVNISYRIDKSVENFVKVINGDLTFSYSHALVSIIGTIAFLGQCYYGTANAIRKLLDLLKIYAGKPESGIGVITSYENWILGATDATLPFAVISYVFSQCVPMFMPSKLVLASDQCQLSLSDVIKFVNLQKKQRADRSMCCFRRDEWYLEALQLFCVTLMPFFVVSVMVGSILPTFNSSNGLIIHALFSSHKDFTQLETLLIAVLSAILTIVFSKIFWSFNVVDWFKQVEQVWVSEALQTLERERLYTIPQEIETFHRDIRRTLDAAENNQAPSCWGRVAWPRLFADKLKPAGYDALAHGEELTGPSDAHALLPA